MKCFFNPNSELRPRIQDLPKQFPELDSEEVAANTSKNKNRKIPRLQALVRACAKETRKRWSEADKKKLAKRLVFSLALKVVLSNIPIAGETFNPFDSFDA